ncbi:MAG: hypothetical protein ABR502_12715 [Chitinophagaceae bacterium]
MRKTSSPALLAKIIACLAIISTIVFLINSCKKSDYRKENKTDALIQKSGKISPDYVPQWRGGLSLGL